MAGIVFNGLEELSEGLIKRMDLNEIRDVVKKNGADLQSTMMRKANFIKGYQTGTTKRSIELEIRDGGLTVSVSPGTEYSPYLEYGTRLMIAQPFVKPAFEAVKVRFKNDLENLVK